LQSDAAFIETRTLGGITMKTSTRCPRCHNELDEGPIMYRCATCCRAVYAADLENEYIPRQRVAA
jgi:tRNA(Ile2) C34 agmatinyltransferase TiaS